MASKQNQELPNLPEVIEPRNPAAVHLAPRGASPRSESPQPMSADEAPDDTRTRLIIRDVQPRPPEDAHMPRTASGSTFPHDPPVQHRHGSQRGQSGLDWIVPMEPKREPRPKTIQERIDPTLTTAKVERDKYELKAKMTGYALNIAIGLQVVLGSLTTGLSAALSGRQISIVISILGGFSTIVASYLARARGSNEPELSITRCKDLARSLLSPVPRSSYIPSQEQYIRECEVFKMDYGHLTGNEHDAKLNQLRTRFEELLGNANG
ncbi:hypothetical protein B0H19DRAFT_1102653 [Mycena capillaripes]|nr:hypothetical protein B0H19DRAFT_1102653 [Mycena capillaripes]